MLSPSVKQKVLALCRELDHDLGASTDRASAELRQNVQDLERAVGSLPDAAGEGVSPGREAAQQASMQGQQDAHGGGDQGVPAGLAAAHAEGPPAAGQNQADRGAPPNFRAATDQARARLAGHPGQQPQGATGSHAPPPQSNKDQQRRRRGATAR